MKKPGRAGAAAYDDQTSPMRRPEGPAPLPVVLRVVETPSVSFRLAAGTCLIGTSKGAHLMLSEPTVSRQHCEVELTQEGVVVSDLSSRNGTYYLGRRVERIVLGPGSSFSVGGVQIAIESGLDRAAIQPETATELGGIQGTSLAIRRLIAVLRRLAGSRVPVLIEGESGVGKSTCARAIHDTSHAARGPFVVLPCASLGRDAQAAELFGASGEPDRSALARADGGTLFLRGIDALSLDLQPGLLDVIENGGTGDRSSGAPPSVRIVASTSRPLEEALTAGKFHEGLFYRLVAIRLEVPPLRTRREDIATIAETLAALEGVPLSEDVVEELTSRAWPGNVRELKSTIAAFAALGVLPAATRRRGGVLDVALDELVDPRVPYAEQKDALVDRFTRRYLEALLEHTDQNQSVAAKLAGLDRSYLGRLLAKLGMSRAAKS